MVLAVANEFCGSRRRKYCGFQVELYIYALCGLGKVPRIVEVLDIPNAKKYFKP